MYLFQQAANSLLFSLFYVGVLQGLLLKVLFVSVFSFFYCLSVIVFGFECVFAATYDCTPVRLGQHTLEKDSSQEFFLNKG